MDRFGSCPLREHSREGGEEVALPGADHQASRKAILNAVKRDLLSREG